MKREFFYRDRRFKKLLRKIISFTVIFLFLVLSQAATDASEYSGEKIIYTISPLGKAEYNDLGLVRLGGKMVNLVTFRTRGLGFDDTEKIYIDPVSLLPLRVERDITMWTGKEYLIEEYDQKNFTLTITKFKKGKKVQEYKFKKDGPIHNAVFLPFYLRKIEKFDIGWSFDARFTETFKIELAAIEKIEVPAGEFIAYHFTSKPNKFEIWISRDNPRLPVKIQGLGAFGYTLSLKKHTLLKKQREIFH